MRKKGKGYKKPCTAGEKVTFQNQDVHRFGIWQCLSSSLSKSWSEEKIYQKLSSCREEEEEEEGGGEGSNPKYDTCRIGGV